MDPEDLIPKLPKPQDLKPFPTVQALVRFWRGLWEASGSGFLLGHFSAWAENFGRLEQMLETGNSCARVVFWGVGGLLQDALFTRLPVPLSRCIVGTPASCAASASLLLGSGWHQVSGPVQPLLLLP